MPDPARADHPRDARARAVVEQRRHGDARELDRVHRDLARHREAQDRGVDGAPRLVVVLVARGRDAEEGRRLAHAEIHEPLRHALDALGELVAAAAQVLEEAAHDDDRGGVGARDLEVRLHALGLDVLPEQRGRVQAAHADVRRGALDLGRLGLAQGVRELGGEGEEVARLHLAADADSRGADLVEDLAEPSSAPSYTPRLARRSCPPTKTDPFAKRIETLWSVRCVYSTTSCTVSSTCRTMAWLSSEWSVAVFTRRKRAVTTLAAKARGRGPCGRCRPRSSS